jgi:ATP adenylyltransferase/5',5'''-P-1,P-4-tetraphosphate phosphorylase II
MFEILQKIEDLLKAEFKNEIKNFMIGDPALVSESNLPCIAISPISTLINIADVSRDLVTYSIEIILIINAKNEIDGRVNQSVGTKFLTNLMEKVDSNGNLDTHTILKVVRDNLRIEKNLEIENENSIEYGIDMKGDQTFVREAKLSLDIMRINNRL